MVTPPVMTELNPPEQRRTYVYPQTDAGGQHVSLAFDNVVRFGRGTTTHRLELADGRKVIVEPGWLAIWIEGCEAWTL